ncbi:MAG: MFS transporter [Chloroflexi bacterium]|nr:MFS transporter [Chloroflexota bacterium]
MNFIKRLPRGPIFYGWFVVLSSFLIYLTISGTRGSFGNFIYPLTKEFGWSVQQVSLAASIGTLCYGLAQPFVGFLVNRRGARMAILGGTLVYGSLTMVLAAMNQLWQLYLVYGILMGTAWGATSNTSNTALISRWFSKRKGLALAFAISGMAVGNFLLIPLSMYLILNIGWRQTLLILGLLVLAIALPVGFKVLRSSPEEKGLLPDGERPTSDGSAQAISKAASTKAAGVGRMGLPQAMRTRPFWLMMVGYFVCGFTALMSSTFFVPMAISNGFAEMDSARAAGVMGAASAAGLWVGGFFSDLVGRKRPLAAFYFMRGLGFFLLLNAHSLPGLYLAALFMGFGAFGTAPITAGLVGDIYGVLNMGTIFGVISMAHQFGGAISIYMTGVIVDVTQSYQWAIIPGVILLMVATTASLAIPEKKMFDTARQVA